jgi:hypothetical protein
MEKSGHYKICSWKKADTTNFSDGKKRTLQTFLMEKSGHYKLCSWKKADTTNFADGKKRTLQTFLMKKLNTTNLCSLTWVQAVGKYMSTNSEMCICITFWHLLPFFA